MKKQGVKVTLPVEGFGKQSLSFVLLSSVYEGSPVQPVCLHIEQDSEKLDALYLAVQGEVISPLLRFFDAPMFMFDYHRFSS
ncbi:MAG: hypothetical protein FJZ58_00065 [Chlamydiae bacterium]|nr:hypothetical protein [Chlamydiota bacterium]